MQNLVTAKLSKYYHDRLKFLNKQNKLSSNPLLKPSLSLMISKYSLSKKSISIKQKEPVQKQNTQKKQSSLICSKRGLTKKKQRQKKSISIVLPKPTITQLPESKRYTINHSENNFLLSPVMQKFKKYSESCQNFNKKQKIKTDKVITENNQIYLSTQRYFKHHNKFYSAMPYKKKGDKNYRMNKTFRNTLREVPKQQILGWETEKIEIQNLQF